MKAENKQLRNWYSSLPRNDFRQKREQIIDNCGITRAIFNNWIQGITVIPAQHYNIINQIARKEILKPLTKEE